MPSRAARHARSDAPRRRAGPDGRLPNGSSPRTRRTPRGCSASPGGAHTKDAFHEHVVGGRAGPSVREVRDEGGGALRPERSGAGKRDDPAASVAGREVAGPFLRSVLRRGLRRADRGGGRLLRLDRAARRHAGREERGAAGVRGPSLVQAVLSLRREGLARRRSGAAASRARAAGRNADWRHSTAATSSRCRTSGSTPGSRPGTSRST
jgi:hypothetical protein